MKKYKKNIRSKRREKNYDDVPFEFHESFIYHILCAELPGYDEKNMKAKKVTGPENKINKQLINKSKRSKK